MQESLKVHVVIQDPDNLGPKAQCFIQHPNSKQNQTTNLEQLYTLLTLQDLIRDQINTNRRLINQLINKLGIQNPSSIATLKTKPLELFYYLDADGGDQSLSDSLISINERVLQNSGRIHTFAGPKACGSAGFGFLTSQATSRYHTLETITGISLNMLETYFVSHTDELESDFTLFDQMGSLIRRKITKLKDTVINSSQLQNKSELINVIETQLSDPQNHSSTIILDSNQLIEYNISTLSLNYYEQLNQILQMSELEATICIQQVYDFLNESIITTH